MAIVTRYGPLPTGETLYLTDLLRALSVGCILRRDASHRQVFTVVDPASGESLPVSEQSAVGAIGCGDAKIIGQRDGIQFFLRPYCQTPAAAAFAATIRDSGEPATWPPPRGRWDYAGGNISPRGYIHGEY